MSDCDYFTESNRYGHTRTDFENLPDQGRHIQPREDHAVPCIECRTLTFNVNGRCDRHYHDGGIR